MGGNMEIGESKITNLVLKMLGSDVRNEIDNYITNVCLRNFSIMGSTEEVREIFDSSIEEFLNNLSEEELLDLRSYTGYNFWNINAVLRNNWRYETNGLLTQEKTREYKEISDVVSNVLTRFNVPDINFMTFRGTTIDAFSSYGINEISELEKLKGKFLYEQAFTSTSILEDSSYFNKILDDGRFCNVGISYMIPAESNDGALLIDNNVSYSANQNEFLLNKGSLSKVIDVSIDENNNTAILTVCLIPKKIYDINYSKNINGVKRN